MVYIIRISIGDVLCKVIFLMFGLLIKEDLHIYLDHLLNYKITNIKWYYNNILVVHFNGINTASENYEL